MSNGHDKSISGCISDIESIYERSILLILFPDRIGFPLAVNRGIEASNGQYIVLLNDDTVITHNAWLHLLERPFIECAYVGITGPFKFKWSLGLTVREALAFWCVMIRRKVIDDIGMLDPIFSPGMGEDGDFCIRAQSFGWKLVQVPDDGVHEFGTGASAVQNFPIVHRGSSTFLESVEKNAIIERNTAILIERWGNSLEAAYHWCSNHTSDMMEFMPVIRKYSKGLKHITEFGTRGCVSCYGMLVEKPERFVTYDLIPNGNARVALDIAKEHGISFEFKAEDVSTAYIEETDLLFFDTEHSYKHVWCGLERHHERVKKYILIHDTSSFGYKDEIDTGAPIQGVMNAVRNFILAHGHEWDFREDIPQGAGLTILERISPLPEKKPRPLISVVIPTYNHCDDLLKPCIETLRAHTDFSNLEVVIVANGCIDNTREYCESLPPEFRLVWSDEPLGYTRATNLGISKSLGEFVVLLNNDIILLDQKHNQWIDMLLEPFSDPKAGITGPLMLHDDYADRDVMIFFCVMIRREVFSQIGYLDEIYSPGGGEDIDFCVKAQDLGWKQVVVPHADLKFTFTNVGGFPIYHLGEGTFSNEEHPEYGKVIIKKNGLLNAQRYNKNIRLNLGCGGIHEKGYLGVDLYDPHAHVQHDITKIHEIFEPGTVAEIMASHVWEHLNPYKAYDTLTNWLRLLKPGGKLAMEMPDIERLCAAFASADKQARYGILNCIYGSIDTVNPSTDGKPTGNITSPHLFGWYPEIVADHLQWAGYVNIRFMDEKYPHPLYNFRVEAEKPL